jgi:hypothetical protein
MNGQLCKPRSLPESVLGFGRVALLFVAGFVGLVLAGASAQGASIVIDNFQDPNPQVGRAIRLFHQENPNLLEHNAVGGTILGGERELEINVVTPAPLPNPFSAVAVIGEGTLDFGADSSSRVVTTLLYDGADGPDANGTMSNSLGLANVDLTMGGNQDGIALNFSAVDAAPGLSTIPLQIIVTSAGGTATAMTNIPEMIIPGTHIVPYSAFNIQGPLSAATSVRFVFNGAPIDQAIDYTLTSIHTVPEPSTLALAGLAAMGLVVARRRRRQS